MIAQQDVELFDWLQGIANGIPSLPDGFLCDLAQCALRATGENYMILRPSLLQFQTKYPEYSYKLRHGQ